MFFHLPPPSQDIKLQSCCINHKSRLGSLGRLEVWRKPDRQGQARRTSNKLYKVLISNLKPAYSTILMSRSRSTATPRSAREKRKTISNPQNCDGEKSSIAPPTRRMALLKSMLARMGLLMSMCRKSILETRRVAYTFPMKNGPTPVVPCAQHHVS